MINRLSHKARRKIKRDLPKKRITVARSIDKIRGTGFEFVEIGKGFKVYLYNGVPHRKDGPAMDFPTSQVWYFNGKIHRDDGGPAATYQVPQDCQHWYIHGERIRWGLTFRLYEREWLLVAISPSTWNNNECFCHLVSGGRKEMVYNFMLGIKYEFIKWLNLPIRELKEIDHEVISRVGNQGI